MQATDAETIARDLEAFLRRSFQIPPEDLLFTRSAHLFDEGFLDSAGVVETIAYLEDRYAIRLPEEVIFDPRFTHVDGIAEVLARTLGSSQARVA